MAEFRHTIFAVREDGAICELAKFKTRDLAEIVMQSIRGRFGGYSFELDSLYRERTTAEFLADDDNFD